MKVEPKRPVTPEFVVTLSYDEACQIANSYDPSAPEAALQVGARMIATPKAKSETHDGFAVCRGCNRKLVHLPNFGWLHLHVKIKDQPRYCR